MKSVNRPPCWLRGLVVLLGMASAAMAQQELSGDLRDTLRLSKSPYLVGGTIRIPPGETVVVQPGVVLMFKGFTGVQVQGRLKVLGTRALPVVFTSENDRRFAPRAAIEAAPYDWDGITIEGSGAGTSFSHCAIQYSLFGINSLSRSIQLDSCVFLENGKADFSVDGVNRKVGRGYFSFGSSYLDEAYVASGLSESKEPVSVKPSAAATSARGTWRRVLVRVAAVALVAGGGTLGAFEMREYEASRAQFNAINDPSNPANTGTAREKAERWDAAYAKKNQDLIGMSTGYALASMGALGFLLTFMF